VFIEKQLHSHRPSYAYVQNVFYAEHYLNLVRQLFLLNNHAKAPY